MDDVMCDFSGARASALSNNPNVKYPQSQLDFFRQLKPIEGAIDGFNYLLDNYDAYIATAPSVCNPLCYTEKALWIKDHFGMHIMERLCIVSHKDLLIGDYLIDDRIDTHGQNKFNGKLIQFGSAEWPNWNSIIDHFKKVK